MSTTRSGTESIADAFDRHRARTDDRDDAPYVCPGCFAVGGEACAAYCVDAAIERDHQDDADFGPRCILCGIRWAWCTCPDEEVDDYDGSPEDCA